MRKINNRRKTSTIKTAISFCDICKQVLAQEQIQPGHNQVKSGKGQQCIFFSTNFAKCSCKPKWSVIPKPTDFGLSCFCYEVSDLPLLSFSSQLCNFSCHLLRLEEASVFHLLNKSPLFLSHFPFPLFKTHLGAKTSCSWLSLMPTLDRREGVKEKDDLQTYSP